METEPVVSLLLNYFTASDIPMWIVDADKLSFLEVNPAATHILGFSESELKVLPINNIQFKDSQESFASLIKYSKEKKSSKLRSAFKTKEGKVLRFKFSTFEFDYQQTNAVLITVESHRTADKNNYENEELFIAEYESELKSFFNNSGSILVLFNKNLEITAFNKQAQIYAISLFNTEFVLGGNVSQILPEIFQSTFKELALKALEGFETKNKEVQIPNSPLWWSLRYYPLYKNDGEIFGASFTAIDISERKKAEEILIKNELRFKSLTQNGSDIISLYDVNFKPIYRSDLASKITGRDNDDLNYNESILQYLHPDELLRLKPTLKILLSTSGIKIHEKFRWRHAAGHYIWLEGTINNLLHDDNINAIVSNMRNITEDIKLREGQSLLASIVDSTDDAVISCHLDGTITSWNKGAEKLLGFAAEETIGDEFKMHIPIDEVLLEARLWDNTIARDIFNQIQSKRVKKNGELIDVSITMSPIRNENNVIVGVSKIIRDVTQLNKSKRDLELLIKELTSNNKELKQFSYITSHNLRGPVTNLIGILRLLEIDKIKDQKTITLLEAFKSSTISLNNTLEDLIQILIIKENTNHELTLLSLEEHLKKVHALISNIIRQSKTKIEYDFGTANTVRFNSAYLESIFLNLITNAIKYSRADLAPHIRIVSTLKDNCVQVSFSDNGTGMDWSKVKDKIFGLYQKFHRHPDSKGIGLFLVHSQITALGGKIEVETALNKGTTFIVTFPPEIF
ncbi:MAG: PAS domain-containing sensor histidine kinase [Bacteroidota bacterium]